MTTPTTNPTIDLDDTRNCPTGPLCEICGNDDRDRAPLVAITVGCRCGVFCLTVCEHCAFDPSWAATLPAMDAARRVWDHCDHLGIYPDQMCDVLFPGWDTPA